MQQVIQAHASEQLSSKHAQESTWAVCEQPTRNHISGHQILDPRFFSSENAACRFQDLEPETHSIRPRNTWNPRTVLKEIAEAQHRITHKSLGRIYRLPVVAPIAAGASAARLTSAYLPLARLKRLAALSGKPVAEMIEDVPGEGMGELMKQAERCLRGEDPAPQVRAQLRMAVRAPEGPRAEPLRWAAIHPTGRMDCQNDP